jgi:transcriptional antiterminator Rof (Rho-off)
MEERYDPVGCDEHDRLEAAAVSRREVEIEFELNGEKQRERGRVGDVYTSDGEEFMRFEAGNGSLEIRLDRVFSVREI